MSERGKSKIKNWKLRYKDSKTGLQPVSRRVEQVHHFEEWVEGPVGAKTLQTDKHTMNQYRV